MPPAPSRPVSEYLKNRVLAASPEELRLLLLEGALKFARQGREGLARKDFEAVFNGLSQCRDVVMELLTTIRTEVDPDLAAKVKALYTFIYTLLVEGGHEKDLKKVDTAIELLDFERETWVMLMQKVAEERTTKPTAAPQGERPALSVQG